MPFLPLANGSSAEPIAGMEWQRHLLEPFPRGGDVIFWATSIGVRDPRMHTARRLAYARCLAKTNHFHLIPHTFVLSMPPSGQPVLAGKRLPFSSVHALVFIAQKVQLSFSTARRFSSKMRCSKCLIRSLHLLGGAARLCIFMRRGAKAASSIKLPPLLENHTITPLPSLLLSS